MPQLPIVSGSVVNTPASGVKIDGSSFRQAALAPGQVGQAIDQSIGGAAEGIGTKLQQNLNYSRMADADLQLRKTKEDFTAKLATMPDPGTWLPAWKQQLDGLREQVIDNPRNGPQVKRLLTAQFNTWEQQSTSEINIQALRKQVADSKEVALADSTYAAHQGDEEGAIRSLQLAVDHHALSAADFKRYSARIPTIAAQARADTMISTDPINAPDAIKSLESKMEPRMFVAIQAKARAAKSAEQTNNLNDYAQQLDLSPDGTIDPKVLEQAVESKQITQRGADALNLRMKGTAKQHTLEDFNAAMANVQDYNFADDKNPAQTIQQMKEDGAHLPTAYRIRYNNFVDKQAKAAQTQADKLEKPVEQQIFSQMREDRMENGMTVPLTNERVQAKWHMFSANEPEKTVHNAVTGGLNAIQNPNKLSDSDIEALYGKGVKREDVIRAEQAHYASIQNKMRDWFRDPANKDATYEQANAYRIELEKPFVMGKVAQAMKPSAPQFKVGGRYKQNGITYEWNGTSMVPVK